MRTAKDKDAFLFIIFRANGRQYRLRHMAYATWEIDRKTWFGWRPMVYSKYRNIRLEAATPHELVWKANLPIDAFIGPKWPDPV